MKIINNTEVGAILAGLRLLQRFGYPKEYETDGELNNDQIEELCEAINCDTFASIPVAQGKITVYAVVSDTDDGTSADLYIDQKYAEYNYIEMVQSYDAVKELLEGIESPTFEEASKAWEEATYEHASGIIDTISLTSETLDIAVPIVKIAAYVEGGVCHTIHSSLPIDNVQVEVFDADNLCEEGCTHDDIQKQQEAFWGDVEKHQVY